MRSKLHMCIFLLTMKLHMCIVALERGRPLAAMEAKMAKEVVDRWMPTSVAELRDALTEMMQTAREDGADADTVYLDVRDLALVRETLTDGSVVFNVAVRENR